MNIFYESGPQLDPRDSMYRKRSCGAYEREGTVKSNNYTIKYKIPPKKSHKNHNCRNVFEKKLFWYLGSLQWEIDVDGEPGEISQGSDNELRSKG